MEEIPSTSNERRKKRDLSQYKEMSTKNVSSSEIKKALTNKHSDLDINCIVWNTDLDKTISVESYDSCVLDFDKFEKYSIAWSKVGNVTPENKPVFDKIRKEDKKKRAEKKAAEEVKAAEEAKAAKSKSNMEDNDKTNIVTDFDNNNNR